MIAPQAANASVPDELLHCVQDPSKISSFDWATYIIDNIMHNARVVEQHYVDKVGGCAMGGFALFVQVFFAEWMDFKIHNLTDRVWPRISAYTSDILKELFALARDPSFRFQTKPLEALSEKAWDIHPLLLHGAVVSANAVKMCALQFMSTKVSNQICDAVMHFARNHKPKDAVLSDENVERCNQLVQQLCGDLDATAKQMYTVFLSKVAAAENARLNRHNVCLNPIQMHGLGTMLVVTQSARKAHQAHGSPKQTRDAELQEACTEKRASTSQAVPYFTRSCSGPLTITPLQVQPPCQSPCASACARTLLQLADQMDDNVEKTPAATLRAPTLPGAVHNLAMTDTSCPLAPRALPFTTASPTKISPGNALPNRYVYPHTPYHLRSHKFVKDVTKKPTWGIKRQQSCIPRIMDTKKQRTDHILPIVQQDAVRSFASNTSTPLRDNPSDDPAHIKQLSARSCKKSSIPVIPYVRRHRSQRAICAILDNQSLGDFPSQHTKAILVASCNLPAFTNCLKLCSASTTKETVLSPTIPSTNDIGTTRTTARRFEHRTPATPSIIKTSTEPATSISDDGVPMNQPVWDATPAQNEDPFHTTQTIDLLAIVAIGMPVPASTSPRTPRSQTAVVQGSNAAAEPIEGPVETTIHNKPTQTTTVHGSLVVPTPMQATHPAEVPVAEGTNPFPNAAQQGTGNINTVPAEVVDLPPDNAAAGPSNWQSMAGMPAPAASKIEPAILIARFHRIIIDPPSPSDVISYYDKMKTCSETELDRKWYSVKEPYLLEMIGHSVQKNFGPGRGLRINGMSAAVRALDAKEDKLYPNRTRRHRKIMSPCFTDEIMYNSKAPCYERFSWMFNASKLKYNL